MYINCWKIWNNIDPENIFKTNNLNKKDLTTTQRLTPISFEWTAEIYNELLIYLLTMTRIVFISGLIWSTKIMSVDIRHKTDSIPWSMLNVIRDRYLQLISDLCLPWLWNWSITYLTLRASVSPYLLLFFTVEKYLVQILCIAMPDARQFLESLTTSFDIFWTYLNW